ncbi:molybdenum cofactor sulfurase [Bryobacterales bacterium F-183]|nr:molybdenum cofactor sulfurase [Bryobacterales bacterium F-183]
METVAVVGTVRALYRYPVKSMAAEPLESVYVGWHGLAGDRRWAFLRPNSEGSGFPWMTIREKPDMWQYRAVFADPADVEGSKMLVRTPDGREFEVTDPELASELGDGVRVMKQYSGIFDTFPLSLLSVQSVDGLASLIEGNPALTPLRFRPNLVIDSSDATSPFPEEGWESCTLRIGEARIRLNARDQRCMMVNVNPDAPADANPAVLRTIAKQRNARFGMYGGAMLPGRVSVGDPVLVER